MKQRSRRATRQTVAALVVALSASACGMLPFGFEADPCAMHSVASADPVLRIGPGRVAATSCAGMVEVRGTSYSVSDADWLIEDSLVLEPYDPISRSNYLTSSAPTFTLAGVDPAALLIAEFPKSPPAGTPAGMQVLLGAGAAMPTSVCGYADPLARGYPSEPCPLAVGRAYSVEMITKCGMDRPMGPYGGFYWRVVNPPPDPGPDSGYPGMYRDLDYGTIELTDDDHAIYVSEMGAELELERITDASAPEEDCELFDANGQP